MATLLPLPLLFRIGGSSSSGHLYFLYERLTTGVDGNVVMVMKKEETRLPLADVGLDADGDVNGAKSPPPFFLDLT